MPKRKLTTREIVDVMQHARTYVDKQLATMAKFGAAPNLSTERYDQLVQDCAKPAIEILEWTAPASQEDSQ